MMSFLLRLAGTIGLAFALWSCSPAAEEELQTVQIGWQIPLATQGQIVQVFKRTDILEQHGFEAEFTPFSFGSPQVEAARSGDLDVIFVGDQPALNLIASGADWKVTSYLFNTRVAIMAEPGGGLDANSLEGKRVGSPFGSVSHREAVLLQRRQGLDPETDVRNLNIDILEIAALVQSGDAWSAVDAVAVWEPSVTLFTERGLAESIADVRTLGVVAASDGFIADDDSLYRLNAAIEEAWAYFLNNVEQVNQWYIEDTGLDYTQEFLLDALQIDRNGAHGDPDSVEIALTEDDIRTLQDGLQWAYDQGYVGQLVDVRQVVYQQ